MVKLYKNSYVKTQYEKVIDTKFSQLANSPNENEQINSSISIDDFFQYYNELFFQIPKTGETNSHDFLIKTSSEYVGDNTVNSDIQALIDEINILQQQNLELNQQLINLQVSSSNG